jgi:3-isopropylmalate/(R)-2-methylmalate dehydratase small subunit
VILPQAEVEKLWEKIESDAATKITVDLEARTVSYAGHTVSFEIDDYTRWRLMEGLDDIGLTMQHVDEIANFEANRPSFKPKTLPVK